ncbi:hypothetical protein C8R45DRAFT_1136530 [Mycena sanguinolenta]|nr:hypothetical protein C8R45DRAFT_1136530 [Mycena sanguinolenta]
MAATIFSSEGGHKIVASSLPNITELSNGLYKHVYHSTVRVPCPVLQIPNLIAHADKAVILDYLKASGVPYTVLYTGWFIENLWKRVQPIPSSQSAFLSHSLHHPDPQFAPEDGRAATWVAHDLGPAALGPLKHYVYADRSKNVVGNEYPVISFKFTYPELRARGGHCSSHQETSHFRVGWTSEMVEVDEMVRPSYHFTFFAFPR